MRTSPRSAFTAAGSAWRINVGETWERAEDELHLDWGVHEVDILLPDQLPNPTAGAAMPRKTPHHVPAIHYGTSSAIKGQGCAALCIVDYLLFVI